MKRNRISEATGSGSAGHFKVPIVLSPQPWTEDQVAPFTNPVYDYNNAELAYEEADGDFKETPEERAKIEKRTVKLSKIATSVLVGFYIKDSSDFEQFKRKIITTTPINTTSCFINSN